MSLTYNLLQKRNLPSTSPGVASPLQPLIPRAHHEKTKTTQNPSQNPLMFGILGFFAAVFPYSLTQIIDPLSSHLFIQWHIFGGLIQVYAATKEFALGHNLSACIFLVFGSNWVSSGISKLLTTAFPIQFPDPNPIIWALWFLVLTILTFAFTFIVYIDKRQGTWLLFWNLLMVGCQFLCCSVDYFSIHAYSSTVICLAGIFGVLGSLCGLYIFFVEAVLASAGLVLPVGRIHNSVDRDRSLEDGDASASAVERAKIPQNTVDHF